MIIAAIQIPNLRVRCWTALQVMATIALLLLLYACASTPAPGLLPSLPSNVVESLPGVHASTESSSWSDQVLPGPVLLHSHSRWVPVAWSELPGLDDDNLFEAWNAWLKSCERPPPAFAALCPDIRRLSIGDAASQRAWMLQKLRPYRVESSSGASSGLLTGYFEPEFAARRLPGAGFTVPLYQAPAGLSPGQAWFSRKQVETSAAAKAALNGRELLYLQDPLDAMLLQIQGSGRLLVLEPDGSEHLVRLAFAGHNGQPYRSIGRWLLDHSELRDASWPGIRAWLARHPQRQQEVLWQNPRMVFFKEEELGDFDVAFGPRGAQGVALTPERSIAVDQRSIPYGTPVWLASSGATMNLARLVLAQDTGSAIQGAVRADYFVGWGQAAGDIAGRLKQPLKLWVLWPK